MIDATQVVLRFRLVLQDLWNNYCWRSEDLRNLESMDDFESWPMRVNTGTDSARFWTPELHDIEASDISFELNYFFDWRLFYWRDYRFYEVKVMKWDSQPEKLALEHWSTSWMPMFFSILIAQLDKCARSMHLIIIFVIAGVGLKPWPRGHPK